MKTRIMKIRYFATLSVCLKFAMFVCCGTVFSGTAGAGEINERFPTADLLRFRHDLLDYYPPTVCALKVLLGSEYEKILANEYEGGSSWLSTRWEELPDPSGGVVAANANYQNIDRRILWVHPDGSIIVGLRRDEGRKVLMFTNNAGLVRRPPAPVSVFLRDMLRESNKPVIKWKAPKEKKLAFSERCSANAMSAKVKAYADAQAGNSCEVLNLENMDFSQWPHAVFPKDKAGRTYLRKEPTRSEGGSRNLPYLIAGDVVHLMAVDFKPKITNGFACACYRSAKGHVSMGWIPQSDIVDIWNSKPSEVESLLRTLPPRKWFHSVAEHTGFPGRYAKDREPVNRLVFSRLPNDSLKISGIRDDMEIKYSPDEMGSIVIPTSGARIARGRHSAPMNNERLEVFLFNNTICIHGNGYGLHYWGIFYP